MFANLLGATSLLFIGFSLAPVNPATPNPPPQAEGYKLVFFGDFTNFSLSPDDYSRHYWWYPGIWFESKTPLPATMTAHDSVVDLMWTRNSGMDDTSIEGCAKDASTCHTYRYGYFEARMKWDYTNGAWPAFWMLPKQGVGGAEQHTGEIDIFEGQGNDPNGYYGTLHEWNGQTQLWTNSPNNRYALPASNNFASWHIYGALWVPGK